jgi:superfamily I DNA/RNA helicase
MINDLFKNIPVKKIFGTAGAGKTTYLISEIEQLFKSGVTPDRIAFVSFTNKAVDEMVERMIVKFPKFEKEQFGKFKTIHAMSFSFSSNRNVMQQKDLFGIANEMGMEISMFQTAEEGGGTKQGDRVMTIEALSRLRMVSLQEQWEDCNFEDCPFHLVKEWQKKLNLYKAEHKLIDFTDMLEKYCSGAIDVDYFFIDEAQDLCALQWNVLNSMAAKCQKIFLAGDDDQAIFNWAGADVEYILNIKAEEEVVLANSHRLPKNIYELSRVVLKKIKNRKPKEAIPTKDNGNITFVNSFEAIDFKEDENYLILVRNRHYLKEVKEQIEQFGLPYFLLNKQSTDCDEVKAIIAWEQFRKGKEISYRDFENVKNFSTNLKKYQRENVPSNLKIEWYKIMNLMKHDKSAYFRNLLEKGYKFSSEPKIKLSTIHQSKGGECDNVIIITDVSYTTWKVINSDNEHRVWYVAITRAKQNLTIVREQSNIFYRI